MGIKVIIMYFLIQMHYKQRSLFVMTGSESRIADQNGRYHKRAYTNAELE